MRGEIEWQQPQIPSKVYFSGAQTCRSGARLLPTEGVLPAVCAPFGPIIFGFLCVIMGSRDNRAGIGVGPYHAGAGYTDCLLPSPQVAQRARAHSNRTSRVKTRDPHVAAVGILHRSSCSFVRGALLSSSSRSCLKACSHKQHEPEMDATTTSSFCFLIGCVRRFPGFCLPVACRY